MLLRSVREQEAELSSLRQQAQLHHTSVEQERQRSSMELGSLHAQLQQQVPRSGRVKGPRGSRCGPADESLCLEQAYRESELAQKLQEEQFSLLQCAVVEAEGIILDAAAKLEDPIHVCCISSPGKVSVSQKRSKYHTGEGKDGSHGPFFPDYLVNRAEVTLASLDKLQQSHVMYLGNKHGRGHLLSFRVCLAL